MSGPEGDRSAKVTAHAKPVWWDLPDQLPRALPAPDDLSYRGCCCHDCDEAARQLMTQRGQSTAAVGWTRAASSLINS